MSPGYFLSRTFLACLATGMLSVHARAETGLAPSRMLSGDDLARPTDAYVGAWGRIECREFIVEAPEWCVQDSPYLALSEIGTTWRFPGAVEEFRQVLEESGVPAEWIDELTRVPVLASEEPPLVIRPPDSILLGLSNETRVRLYARLGLDHSSDPYRNPIQLSPGGIPRLVRSAPAISPNLVELIGTLTYTRLTGIPYLSDIGFVLRKAGTEEERIRVLQFLTREASEHAWLNLDRATDRKHEMLAYWSAGGRNPDAPAMLTSAMDNPDVTRLELFHLLPPGPREMLNTYPAEEESFEDRFPNCFATAFSFFADSIPPRFLDTRIPDVMSRYERAAAPWQLGDVVAIANTRGDWLHVCNYVGGELVFTKNGRSLERPWVLQKMDDVFAAYLLDERLDVVFYRLKPGFHE